MTQDEINQARQICQRTKKTNKTYQDSEYRKVIGFELSRQSNEVADLLGQVLNALEAAQQDQVAVRAAALKAKIASLQAEIAGEKQAKEAGFIIGKHRAIRVLAGTDWGVGQECFEKIVPVIERIIKEIREIKE